MNIEKQSSLFGRVLGSIMWKTRLAELAKEPQSALLDRTEALYSAVDIIWSN